MEDEENEEYEAALSVGQESEYDIDEQEGKHSKRVNRKRAQPEKRTRSTARHMPEPDYFLSAGDESDDAAKSN